uniref:CARD domain-containing protein n=1 Tax=Plectus sambesii TaxID=2011161 RepID=A0A914W7C7_9BILA
MSEQHRELIRKCQVQFIQAIVDSQCLGSLIYKLISQNQNGDIGSILQDLLWLERGNYANEAEKVRVFLEILCARGHIAIDHFFKVIIDTKHARLISVLTSQMPPNRQTGNERTRYFQDNRYNQGHMITGGNFDNAIFNQQTHYDAPISNYSFENYNHGGVNVNGAIHGETVVQGDQYIYIHDTRFNTSQGKIISSSTNEQL